MDDEVYTSSSAALCCREKLQCSLLENRNTANQQALSYRTGLSTQHLIYASSMAEAISVTCIRKKAFFILSWEGPSFLWKDPPSVLFCSWKDDFLEFSRTFLECHLFFPFFPFVFLSCAEALSPAWHERHGVHQSHLVPEDQSGQRLRPESTDQRAGQRAESRPLLPDPRQRSLFLWGILPEMTRHARYEVGWNKKLKW